MQVRSLSDDGRLDLLTRADGDRYVRKGQILSSLHGVTLATPAENDGEAFLVLCDSSMGTSRIERWNLDDRKLIDKLSEPFQGECVALAADASRVAYAVQENGKWWVKVHDLKTGNTSDSIELPEGIRVTFLSLSPADDRLVICTQAGNAYIAKPDANGDWQRTEIDRDDISVAIFSPYGERMILGTNTGQVQIVKPQESDGALVARLLLTLPGHSHPVTALRFAEQESKLALLSGDAAGRVLIHPLQ
jgi:WD40 repeat protein